MAKSQIKMGAESVSCESPFSDSGVCVLSRNQLVAAPWTVSHQAPKSVESSRQEYCMGLPCPTPADFPDPGIKLAPSALEGDFFYHCAVWEARSHLFAVSSYDGRVKRAS